MATKKTQAPARIAENKKAAFNYFFEEKHEAGVVLHGWEVKAVREGRVYSVPRWPHNWIDRPPSVMRVLGVQWLAGLFYPTRLPFDRQRHTREFYQRFFGVTLSEADVDRLFQ